MGALLRLGWARNGVINTPGCVALGGFTSQPRRLSQLGSAGHGKRGERTVDVASTASGQMAFRDEPQAGQGGSCKGPSPGGWALEELRRTPRAAAVSLQRSWCSAGAEHSGSGGGREVALQHRATRRRATREPRGDMAQWASGRAAARRTAGSRVPDAGHGDRTAPAEGRSFTFNQFFFAAAAAISAAACCRACMASWSGALVMSEAG